VDTALAQSFEHCRALAKRSGSNFYLSFLLLPREKNDALCVIYAFMRHCDDLVDNVSDPAAAKSKLAQLRAKLDARLAHAASENGVPDFWMALAEIVRRYNIPPRHLREVVDGCEMDLCVTRYETFEDLYRYCYGVAAAVGLVCLRVFGFRDDAALKPAEYMGIAFQLTNILRDIKEDAARGRIYLPLEDLRQFEVTEQELLDGKWSERVERLIHFEADRAESFYTRAHPLVGMVNADSRDALAAMEKVYHAILHKIQRPGFNVLKHRARLAAPEKLTIFAQAKIARALGGAH
jgi:phytoene synthase